MVVPKKNMVHKFEDVNEREKLTLPERQAVNDAIFRDIEIASKKQHPNFYAILPADIRYHEELSYFEKILYAEISALANEKGFCYATNWYFTQRFNLSTRTITRAIQNLLEANLIITEFEQVGKSIFRKIYMDRRDVKRPFPMENLSSDQVLKLLYMGYTREQIKELVLSGKKYKDLETEEPPDVRTYKNVDISQRPDFESRDEAEEYYLQQAYANIVREGEPTYVPDIYQDMVWMLQDNGDYIKVSPYSQEYMEFVEQVGRQEADRIDSLCSDRRVEPQLNMKKKESQSPSQLCLPPAADLSTSPAKDVYNNNTNSTVSTKSTKSTNSSTNKNTKSTNSTPSTISTPAKQDSDKSSSGNIVEPDKSLIPSWLGRTSELRLAKLYEMIYEYTYSMPVKLKLIGKERAMLKSLMTGRSEIKAGLAIVLHFEWRGMSGEDGMIQKRLFEQGFPLSMAVKNIRLYDTFMATKMGIDDDEDAYKQVKGAIDTMTTKLGYRLQND